MVNPKELGVPASSIPAGTKTWRISLNSSDSERASAWQARLRKTDDSQVWEDPLAKPAKGEKKPKNMLKAFSQIHHDDQAPPADCKRYKPPKAQVWIRLQNDSAFFELLHDAPISRIYGRKLTRYLICGN